MFKNKISQKQTAAGKPVNAKSFKIKQTMDGNTPVAQNASRKVSFSIRGKQTVRVSIHCGSYFNMYPVKNLKTEKTEDIRARGPLLSYKQVQERPDLEEYADRWYAAYPKTRKMPDPNYSAPQPDGSTIIMEHLEDGPKGEPRYKYVAKNAPVYLTRVSPDTLIDITEEEVQAYFNNIEKLKERGNNPMLDKAKKSKFVRNEDNPDDTNWYHEVNYPESNRFPVEINIGCIVGREVVDGKQVEDLELYLAVSNGKQSYTNNGFMKNAGSGTFSAGSFSRWILEKLPIGEAIKDGMLNYGEVILDKRIPQVYTEHYEKIIGEHDETDSEPDVMLFKITKFSFKRENNKALKAKKGKPVLNKATQKIEITEDNEI